MPIAQPEHDLGDPQPLLDRVARLHAYANDEEPAPLAPGSGLSDRQSAISALLGDSTDSEDRQLSTYTDDDEFESRYGREREPQWYDDDRYQPMAAAPRESVSIYDAHLPRRKSTLLTYMLWLVLGVFGGHRYYLGDNRTAAMMTVSLGGLGMFWLWDFFHLPGLVRAANSDI